VGKYVKEQTMSSHCLTAREREVCELLITGATNRRIAGKLCISENTVEFHLRHIFAKLDASSRTEAAVTYLRSQVLPGRPKQNEGATVGKSR
jgi:DNA-binding CsgD family transcriptional regulator